MNKARAEVTFTREGLLIKALFNSQFVEWVKKNVPPMHRKYDPKNNQWLILPEFAPRTFQTLSMFFTFIEDDQRSNRKDGWDPDEKSSRKSTYEDANSAGSRAHNQKRYDSRDPGAKHTYEPPPPPKQKYESKRDKAFATLYLVPNAPGEVVKAVFRTLSKLNHPDRNPGDTTGANERMKSINSAYDLLK